MMRWLPVKLNDVLAAPRVRLAAIVTASLLMAFGLGGAFILPIWLKTFATEKIEQVTGRKVSIGSLHINPFALSARITDFKLLEPDGQTAAVAIGEAYIDASVVSLFKRAIILDGIRVTHPTLLVTRLTSERFSFSDIVDRMAASPKVANSAAISFSLNNIQLIDGRIDFDDRVTGKQHHIDQLNFAVPFISDLSHDVDIFVVPSLSANINGSPLLIKSKTKPFSNTLESSFDVELNKLDIPTYLGLIPLNLDYRPISGKLDTQLEISFKQIRGATPQIAISGNLTVSDLAVTTTDPKKPAFLAKQIALRNVTYNLTTNNLHVGTLRINTPSVFAERFADGRLNLLPTRHSSFRQSAAAGSRSPDSPVVPALMVNIDSWIVQNGSAYFEDISTTPSVQIQADELQLNAHHVTTKSGEKIPFEFSAKLNRAGKIELNGDASPDPLAVDVDVDIERLGLDALQGYVAAMLNIDIHRLNLTTRGKLHLVKETGNPHVTYTGDADFTNLITLDKVNDAPFLNWKALDLKRIEFEYPAPHAPLKLVLGAVMLSDFYARIIINSTGRLNLQDVLMKPDASAPVSVTTPTTQPAANTKADTTIPQPAPLVHESQPGTQPIVRVGRTSVAKGRVNFTDNYIKPNYTANITNLAGTIGRVASDNSAAASLDWHGKLDGDGVLDIQGQINPLSPQLFLDLTADAKDIELTRLTPYASKYAGYPIEKGKLSVDVKYHVENEKLQAENHLFVDQLTFGDHVDSPDATKLPVLLAVALLKNSRGEIDINLPVSGSLSDPQFSIGGLIVRVIVNLLVKVATSPFTLISSMFGDSEELGYVEFVPGSAILLPADTAKLDKLAAALSDRPALKLDVSGRVDPATDTLIYKASLQKLRELRKRDPATEEAGVNTEDYPKYLKEAYDRGKFAKPRNFIGVAKSLPREEMEKLILANTSVDDNDMHELAMRRAANVRDYLVDKAHISNDRVFLVAPRLNAAGINDNGKPNRVDFSLK